MKRQHHHYSKNHIVDIKRIQVGQETKSMKIIIQIATRTTHKKNDNTLKLPYYL